MKDALDAIHKAGWRLWSLSEGYDRLFRAVLWNPVLTAEKPFSGTGIGSTPENAVRAAMTSETRAGLWDGDEMDRYRRPPKAPPDLLLEATAARVAMTKALRA